MPYSDFSICYRAGKNEQDAKNGRLIWLPLLEISCLKDWGLHTIVLEAWTLNCLISGLFFQLLRHFLKNWLRAVIWNLAGVFLRQSSRNLMVRFLIKTPIPEILRFKFCRFRKRKCKPQYFRTGALIKNHYIRFLEPCLRNTPAKFQTTALSQFFRKWCRSWKNSPDIRRFKVQAIDWLEFRFRFRFRWTLLTGIWHLIWYKIWWIYSYKINFTERRLNWINQHTTFVGKFLMKQTILILHFQNLKKIWSCIIYYVALWSERYCGIKLCGSMTDLLVRWWNERDRHAHWASATP